MYRIVLRGPSYHRQRPENSRFVAGSDTDSLVFRKITDAQGKDVKEQAAELNWLGVSWMKELNENKMASLNQSEKGLIAEAMVQLRLAMGKVKDQQSALQAQINIKKTWQDLLAEAEVVDRDQPLGEMEYNEEYDCYDYKGGGILLDPNSSAVALILAIYQFENFCYKELNRSSR